MHVFPKSIFIGLNDKLRELPHGNYEQNKPSFADISNQLPIYIFVVVAEICILNLLKICQLPQDVGNI